MVWIGSLLVKALSTSVAFQKLVNTFCTLILDSNSFGESTLITQYYFNSGWAFDDKGVIWGVGRNEDGDDTGNIFLVFSIPLCYRR